jgi:hypothetical protein
MLFVSETAGLTCINYYKSLAVHLPMQSCYAVVFFTQVFVINAM